MSQPQPKGHSDCACEACEMSNALTDGIKVLISQYYNALGFNGGIPVLSTVRSLCLAIRPLLDATPEDTRIDVEKLMMDTLFYSGGTKQ